MRSITAPLTLALAVAVATPALAGQPPADSIVYSNLTAARVNPLGLIELFELSYKHRLFDSKNPLLENNFVQFGLRPALTPAWARLAAVVRVQPLSILQLWAEYGLGGHFGSFGLMQSFDSADAPTSDTFLDEREAAGENYAATGSQFALGVLLQGKVGPVAVRSSARFVHPDHDLKDGDRAFYDIIYDIVIPNNGWAVNNDFDALYVSDFGLAAGVRWTYTHVFTRQSDFRPLSDSNPNSPMHRVGPLVAYTFWDEPGTAFDKPTVLLIANWWLKHRFRTGEDVSQALPYIVVGFRFSGDLWRGE